MTKRKAPEDRLKVGRPSKLTPELQEALCDDIRNGLFVELAAEARGIGFTTVYRWARENPEFRQALREAERHLQLALLDVIKVGDSGWNGSLAVLERRFPRSWSIRARAAASDREDEILKTLRERMGDEEFQRVVSILAGESEEGAGAAEAVEAKQLPAS